MATQLRGGRSHALPPPALAGAAFPTTADRFFDLAVDLLCLAGVDGYFKVLNRAWSESLGYSDDELLSRPYLDFVHPDDRDATVAEASKLAAGFRTVHFRNRYRCKDGSYKWLAWTASPAMGEGIIYGAARDVTEEMHVQADAARLVHQQRAGIRHVLATNAVTPVFQPIMSLPALELRGFEALSRFASTPVRPPSEWFEDADAAGIRPELEMHAIRTQLAASCRVAPGAYLSINASPETLLSDEFGRTVRDVDTERLVVEVTEHAAVQDYVPLQEAINRLRQHGIRLAIDDAGSGFASLKHVVRLVPEFIKLDLFLIRDVDSDPVKRAVVAAMVGFAAEIGSQLVAEGVEEPEELSVLADLGVGNAQGFYLGRPGPLPG